LDNYTIHENGTIQKEKTNDKTDNFKYQSQNGETVDLGTYEKVQGTDLKGNKKDLLLINKDGSSYFRTDYFLKNVPDNKYLDPFAFAGFLGASYKYFKETGLKVQVNQFSTITGSHSVKSSGQKSGSGDYIDIRYSNSNGNKDEKVLTNGSNYDKRSSQILVNNLYDFGYSSTTKNPKGTYRPSILTYNSGLTRTHKYANHNNHMHLQNYVPIH
jgi:hypothetical protein